MYLRKLSSGSFEKSPVLVGILFESMEIYEEVEGSKSTAERPAVNWFAKEVELEDERS